MGLIDNFKHVRDRIKKTSKAGLKTTKDLLFFAVLADIFGLYYFLGLKTIAMALLLVIITGIVIVLLLERKYKTEDKKLIKSKKEVKHKMDDGYMDLTGEQVEEEPKEEKKDDSVFGDLGLGNPDETQKNIENALGTF